MNGGHILVALAASMVGLTATALPAAPTQVVANEARQGARPTQVLPPHEQVDRFTVYLVTAAPGDAIWERFGHNGLWIHDGRTGEDIFWEWGLFDRRQEGFMARLARGSMLYSMGGRYLADRLAAYAADDRQVWAQELNLTTSQERALDRLVRENARPENRDYTYDYYADNCSTRARDALDAVLGGYLRETFSARPAGVTWRWHTQSLLRAVPWAEAGVQIVLGRPGDEQITEWDEMFLPLQLRRHLAQAEIPGPDGSLVPLVLGEEELLSSARANVPTEPRNRLPLALVVGIAMAAGVVGLGRRNSEGSVAQRSLGLFLAGWSCLAGGLGAALIAAWVLTDHDHWRWNENVFVLNPLLLGATIPGVALALGRRPAAYLDRLLRAVAISSLMAILLKLLPGSQDNRDVLVVALSLNLALAVVLSRKSAAPPSTMVAPRLDR